MMKILNLLFLGLLSISLFSCKDKNNPVTPVPGEIPDVALVSPTAKTEILDSVYVEISANDNKGITRVDFIIDNVVIRSWTVAPYKAVIDLSMYNDSSLHIAYVKAYDADSNYKTSPVLTLTFRRLFTPDNFWAESISDKIIKLHWRDRSNFETGYQVEMSGSDNIYKTIGTTSANDSLFVVNDLDTSVTYNFRVKPLRNNYVGSYTSILGLSYQTWWESKTFLSFNNNYPRSMVYARTKGLVITGTSAGSIQINNYSDSKFIKSISAHTNTVLALALSPDGNYFASSSYDYSIKIWNMSNYSLVRTITTSSTSYSSISYSPDGTMLAALSNYDARIWNASTGTLIRSIYINYSNYSDICFSKDGSMVIFSDGSSIKFVRISDGTLVNTIPVTSTVYALALSPDGQTIAIGSSDYLIRLYDAGSGNLLNTLLGHTNSVGLLCFSEDNKLLLSSDSYYTVKMWNLDSSACIYSGSQYYNNLYCLSFGIDNNTFICNGSSYNLNIIRKKTEWRPYYYYKH